MRVGEKDLSPRLWWVAVRVLAKVWFLLVSAMVIVRNEFGIWTVATSWSWDIFIHMWLGWEDGWIVGSVNLSTLVVTTDKFVTFTRSTVPTGGKNNRTTPHTAIGGTSISRVSVRRCSSTTLTTGTPIMGDASSASFSPNGRHSLVGVAYSSTSLTDVIERFHGAAGVGVVRSSSLVLSGHMDVSLARIP